MWRVVVLFATTLIRWGWMGFCMRCSKLQANEREKEKKKTTTTAAASLSRNSVPDMLNNPWDTISVDFRTLSLAKKLLWWNFTERSSNSCSFYCVGSRYLTPFVTIVIMKKLSLGVKCWCCLVFAFFIPVMTAFGWLSLVKSVHFKRDSSPQNEKHDTFPLTYRAIYPLRLLWCESPCCGDIVCRDSDVCLLSNLTDLDVTQRSGYI